MDSKYTLVAQAIFARGISDKATDLWIENPGSALKQAVADEIIDDCVEFNVVEQYVRENKDSTFEKSKDFCKKYKEKYPEETTALNELAIESSLLADDATNPVGYRDDWYDTINAHNTEINRLTKIVDAY